MSMALSLRLLSADCGGGPACQPQARGVATVCFYPSRESSALVLSSPVGGPPKRLPGDGWVGSRHPPPVAMDLPSLAIVLRAALSHVPEERKAAEESLNQFQYTPQHLVRLLQIIVDGSCDLAVRQVASIHFKNFIAKNWSPNDPDESQKVLDSDKAMVRENILGFIIQVPPLLR
ncbi:hypothetical protein PR202_gb08501 [Eleusine coracana subsp. coracana]|uniref:Importin N-terminal domain-containing protein n=1 Tax=Eleusine coracana subsp. coracana TaxID=191504 RepID=A0AAV5EFP8_ELECO|nr:hypothetical protein PR202_gb08501 [Eleusine coracana subsp. coracana]